MMPVHAPGARTAHTVSGTASRRLEKEEGEGGGGCEKRAVFILIARSFLNSIHPEKSFLDDPRANLTQDQFCS